MDIIKNDYGRAITFFVIAIGTVFWWKPNLTHAYLPDGSIVNRKYKEDYETEDGIIIEGTNIPYYVLFLMCYFFSNK